MLTLSYKFKRNMRIKLKSSDTQYLVVSTGGQAIRKFLGKKVRDAYPNGYILKNLMTDDIVFEYKHAVEEQFAIVPYVDKRKRDFRAVEWIALNDEPNETDPDAIAAQISVLLVADVFNLKPEHIAQKILKMRAKR